MLPTWPRIGSYLLVFVCLGKCKETCGVIQTNVKQNALRKFKKC